MPVNNFPIFQFAKRKKIYLEFYSLSFIIVASIAFIWMQALEEIHAFVFWLITVIFILSFVPLITTLILNHYKIDFKKGSFKGNLILGKNEIQVAEQIFQLKNIESIHFINDDFFIRYERNKWIGPKISSGVGNSCTIKLKDGKIVQFNFFQSHDNELVKAELMLKYYNNQNILSEMNLKRILEG